MYSLVASAAVIIFYTPVWENSRSLAKRKFRMVAINGEPVILVLLSMIHPG